MTLTRRQFVAGTSSLTLLGSPIFSSRADQLKKKNLVIVILRGGLDGLGAVPVIDRRLSAVRPDIGLSSPNKITSDFMLHSKLATFFDLWKKNKASVVHATNIPYTQRSHFEGQNLMESGGYKPYSHSTGWLGRGMETAELQGLAISLPMPLLLRGRVTADNFYPSWMQKPGIESKIKASMASHDVESPVFEAMERIVARPFSMMNYTGGGNNPAKLAKIAAEQLRLETGPRVAVFDINGFDTHAAQGGDEGELGRHLFEFDTVIKELATHLDMEFENSLILSLTEFGRKLEQNGGKGTEHGYGTAILMAGGLIKQAQVYTDWPGLKHSELFEGQDLNSTIDARAVYCSAMSACFDIDFAYMRRKAFWNHELPDLTEKLFRV